MSENKACLGPVPSYGNNTSPSVIVCVTAWTNPPNTETCEVTAKWEEPVGSDGGTPNRYIINSSVHYLSVLVTYILRASDSKMIVQSAHNITNFNNYFT